MIETIEKYAHDYRDMKMSQEELSIMLTSFARAFFEGFKGEIKDNLEKAEENYKEAKSVAGINSCGACNADGEMFAYNIVLDLIK